MADKRITDLTPITAGDLDAQNDVLAVADVSAAETKLKVADAIAASIGGLPATQLMARSSSTTASKAQSSKRTALQPVSSPRRLLYGELLKSVTQAKLADGSVGTDQLLMAASPATS